MFFYVLLKFCNLKRHVEKNHYFLHYNLNCVLAYNTHKNEFDLVHKLSVFYTAQLFQIFEFKSFITKLSKFSSGKNVSKNRIQGLFILAVNQQNLFYFCTCLLKMFLKVYLSSGSFFIYVFNHYPYMYLFIFLFACLSAYLSMKIYSKTYSLRYSYMIIVSQNTCVFERNLKILTYLCRKRLLIHFLSTQT